MVDCVGHATAEPWLCPERSSDVATWTAAIDRLRDATQRLSDHYASIPAIYGLELRCAYFALRNALPLAAADNPYWREKTGFLFRRPALEPIILSFWKRHADRPLDDAAALQTASLLTCAAARFRGGPAVGQSLQGYVRFEPAELARNWSASVADLQMAKPSRSEWPAFVYAKTVMAHPFEDGNGRFARLLFAATLAAQLRVKRPCLALAPSFYRHAEQLSGAITILSKTADWQPLTAALIQVVDEAVALTALSASGTAAGQKPDG